MDFFGGNGKRESYFFNLEMLTPAGDAFADSTGAICKAVDLVSIDKAYSGKNSVKTDKDHQFALQFTPKVKAGATVEITVKRWGGKKAVVVMTDDNGFYLNEAVINKVSDWDELKLTAVLPANVSARNFKIYVWNPSDAPAYFDDLNVDIITPLK